MCGIFYLTFLVRRGERIGQSIADAHDQYADEQLTTIQKRICLIEFLFMVGLLFVKEKLAPTADFHRSISKD